MTAILRDAPSAKIPQLSPVETRPLRHRGSANSNAFLKSIERIHISDVVMHHGVAYYVIDVYVNKSQIPTIREMRRAKLASTTAGKVPQSNKTIRYQRTPDFQVLHRYREFEQLRNQIFAIVDRVWKGECKCCSEWMSYISFSFSQPRFFTKMLTSTELRRQLLTKFLCSVVLLTIQTSGSPVSACHTTCVANSQIVSHRCFKHSCRRQATSTIREDAHNSIISASLSWRWPQVNARQANLFEMECYKL
ncbi:hypothetical protein PINS_up006390 [Pythium insidiosum]|nr:hypothetical protein PINS_up006390 [Pythium insidiosum]